MSQRFFSAVPLSVDSTIEIDGQEAHHLLHVMRCRVDDQVTLFDGRGSEFTAVVMRTTRHAVIFHVTAELAVDRERAVALTLAVALPRGDRQEWLVQKAVELGVTRLIPWETQRSVAEPSKKVVERLQRTVIEAAKQCGRNQLMEITAPRPFAESIREPLASDRWLSHPYGAAHSISKMIAAAQHARPASIAFGIGPEGGLTDEEVASAIDAGWKCLELGPRIVRTETAAIALAAIGLLLDTNERRATPT